MPALREHDLTQYSPNTFPASGRYVGSRLEDLRVALVLIERHTYRSLRIVDQVNPHWTLSFIKQGNVSLTCEGETWHGVSGDVMVLPPHLACTEIADQPGLHEYLHCDATLAERIDILRFFPVAPVVTLLAPDDYSRQFGALYRAWRVRDTEFWGLTTMSLTTDLLERVLTSWRAAGSPARPTAMLTQVDRFASLVAYMSLNISEKISRADLAERICLHPVYLDRAFRNIYGKSVMQMLREMRLHKAKALLETGDLPLSAVANECGLGTATYLIHVFREFYGMTPNAYRQSLESAIRTSTSAGEPHQLYQS